MNISKLMTFIFRNRKIFWNISKLNSRQKNETEGVIFKYSLNMVNDALFSHILDGVHHKCKMRDRVSFHYTSRITKFMYSTLNTVS